MGRRLSEGSTAYSDASSVPSSGMSRAGSNNFEISMGGRSYNSIEVQHSGYLRMKHVDDKVEKKVFCVVKDGFFVWYSSNAHNGFNVKPKGVIPLPQAFTEVSNTSKKAFELVHPNICKCEFLLKCESSADVKEWLLHLNNAKKACFENAKLGAALIEQLRAKGTEIEAEKKKAVELLEEKAREVDKINRDLARIMERDRKQVAPLEKKLQKVNSMVDVQKDEAKALEMARVEEEKVYKKAAEDRRQLVNKIDMARRALFRIERALQSGMSDNTHNTHRKPSQVPGIASYKDAKNYWKTMNGGSKLDQQRQKKIQEQRSAFEQKRKAFQGNSKKGGRFSNQRSSNQRPATQGGMTAAEQGAVNSLKAFFEDTSAQHLKQQNAFVGKKVEFIATTLRRTKKKGGRYSNQRGAPLSPVMRSPRQRAGSNQRFSNQRNPRSPGMRPPRTPSNQRSPKPKKPNQYVPVPDF